MAAVFPFDTLTDEEERRLLKAIETLRAEIIEKRATGRPAGIVIRANLSPCGPGTPSILRGFKYIVEHEDA